MILSHAQTNTCVDTQTQPTSKIYEYQIPLLDNKTVRFPDKEPDITKMLITHLDLDLTEVCNLSCSYCFKGKLRGQEMSLETVKQLTRFLVRYSGSAQDITIAMLGGEPLLAFPLLKEWTPWAKKYCRQRGKNLNLQVTTNGTVFQQKHHDFFRYWRIGLHLSLDGCPQAHDQERKFANGRGSSQIIEQNLPAIFSAWRTVHARSTIVPETVEYLFDSYRYFCAKGFLRVAFCLANSEKWNNPQILDTLSGEFRRVLQYHWDLMKEKKRHFTLSYFDGYVESKEKNEPISSICGAARGTLHVDADGFLWPCHRFNGLKRHEYFVLGSIWGGFNNMLRDCYMNINPLRDFVGRCKTCPANKQCLPTCICANWQINDSLFEPGQDWCRARQVIYNVCREHADQMQKQEPQQWQTYINWIKNMNNSQF